MKELNEDSDIDETEDAKLSRNNSGTPTKIFRLLRKRSSILEGSEAKEASTTPINSEAGGISLGINSNSPLLTPKNTTPS